MSVQVRRKVMKGTLSVNKNKVKNGSINEEWDVNCAGLGVE